MISADSHVTEPSDLWTSRLDKKYRARAPRIEHTVVKGRPGLYFVCDGLHPRTIAHGIACDRSPEELPGFFANPSLEEARAGGWDPGERLKDMDIDGLRAEVLYTTFGFRLFWLHDAAFQEACFRAYNDWLAEYCSHAPGRLVGLGLISLYDIDHAVAELQRCARMGLRGALIWCSPPNERPYSSGEYDRFFAAAQDLGMPLSLHAVTGMGPESQWFCEDRYVHFMYFPLEVQRTLTSMICGGVLERFPRLRLVSAENGIGWIPHFLQRLDSVQDMFHALYPRHLPLKASDYYFRQVSATFQSDPIGVGLHNLAGEDNIMWCSDYPHAGCTWPRSQVLVEGEMGGLDRDVFDKITDDNAARLYGIEILPAEPKPLAHERVER